MDKIQEKDLINLGDPNDPTLVEYLRGHNVSLKPTELTRIRSLMGRDPTTVELHIFNVMWSEHCSYKSSRPVLGKYLPTDAPHVVMGPGEDAGIIRFHEKDGTSYCLVMAHESHNHPSQVLPAEGAATGIGGIVRDVYCMAADVIGVLDPLRFGNPDGPRGKRVRTIVEGVVDGIAQYGNALGVPNLGGETFFDGSFDDNCLVNVVALGIVPEGHIIRSRAPESAKDAPYDVILIGKPTDASGFGGAAFASERLSGDEAVEQQEAVQVPDPFLKRVLAEATKKVLAQAREQNVSIGFKDLGAGGISCAISEMAQAGGVGATIDLDKVAKSSEMLPAEVIACSETQERYAMFAPDTFTEHVLRIYNEDFDLPRIYAGAGAYRIGRVTTEKRFRLSHHSQLVCDADVDAITTGIEYEREMRAPRSTSRPDVSVGQEPPIRDALLKLLSSYNIGDKSTLFQHYDCEVQGRAVLRPGEADAAVTIFLPGDTVGLATGIGSNSLVGSVDPYMGGVWSVCEAVRNVACVGGRALAVTDCLNYGDPEDPEVFWTFCEGVRGIGDACRNLKIQPETDHGLPVISGNVSFYNQSEKGLPIAPTPIVACAGRVEDVSVSGGFGLKQAASSLILLGALHDSLGGSEYAARFAPGGGGSVPMVDFASESKLIRTLVEGFGRRMVLSAHDIGHGGLLVALAEMILGAPHGIGCDLDLVAVVPSEGAVSSYLFSELGGIVVEVASDKIDGFLELIEREDCPYKKLGRTSETHALSVTLPGETIDVTFEDLDRAHRLESATNKLFS